MKVNYKRHAIDDRAELIDTIKGGIVIMMGDKAGQSIIYSLLALWAAEQFIKDCQVDYKTVTYKHGYIYVSIQLNVEGNPMLHCKFEEKELYELYENQL